MSSWLLQTFLQTQPRIEAFLNKDISLSTELRCTQLNGVIIEYYGIDLPLGLIEIIVEFENNGNVIHHQYQQYVAPKLLNDFYPRSLLSTYKVINYASSIITLCASFYHLHRWLNQAAITNSDALPSTASIHPKTTFSDRALPKFLTLFPIPGSFSIFHKFSPNFDILYPSVHTILPIFGVWTGCEFIKNLIYFNTNRNIQKLAYFMPINAKTKSVNNALFNDWNEFLYSDNFGLCPKRFIASYTSMMFGESNENLRFAMAENEEKMQRHSPSNSIIVPLPKYALQNQKLPLPKIGHFLLQNNTLFALIMFHCTLLPISRCLLKFNDFFLPNITAPNTKRFASLQSITSHRNESLNYAMSGLMKVSNIVSSHIYCLLHVVSTTIMPVICLRSLIFGNISTHLQNVLHPMQLNNNANAANVALAQQQQQNDDEQANNHRNAFEEYIDKWSLSNHLTSISLMLSMVPYVNNFYAMLSVFSFGMTLGEGEDIMRWSEYRLTQNNINHTHKIRDVLYAHYIPWIAGVVGITCSFTIEVWASSNNVIMAQRFKRISLICILLSICMSFGNRSYLESGFYLKYKNGRNLFEKMTQFAVEIEVGIKQWIKSLNRQKNERNNERLSILA